MLSTSATSYFVNRRLTNLFVNLLQKDEVHALLTTALDGGERLCIRSSAYTETSVLTGHDIRWVRETVRAWGEQ
jgi:hypothetical protein